MSHCCPNPVLSLYECVGSQRVSGYMMKLSGHRRYITWLMRPGRKPHTGPFLFLSGLIFLCSNLLEVLQEGSEITQTHISSHSLVQHEHRNCQNPWVFYLHFTWAGLCDECFEGRVTVFDENSSVGAFMSVEQEQSISLELTEEKAEFSNIWTNSVLRHLDRPSLQTSGQSQASNIWTDSVLKHLDKLLYLP